MAMRCCPPCPAAAERSAMAARFISYPPTGIIEAIPNRPTERTKIETSTSRRLMPARRRVAVVERSDPTGKWLLRGSLGAR
jgi:hypothetical protein